MKGTLAMLFLVTIALAFSLRAQAQAVGKRKPASRQSTRALSMGTSRPADRYTTDRN